MDHRDVDKITEIIKNQTPEEFVDSLVRSGIIDKYGNLLDKYKTKEIIDSKNNTQHVCKCDCGRQIDGDGDIHGFW